jgi:hypothetical protein
MNHQTSSLPAVEIAQMWHDLAECQLKLDVAAAQARAGVALPAIEAEDGARIGVAFESAGDRVTIRVVLAELAPETLRVWVTPDLALLRARTPEGALIARLVRLPAQVDPDSAETNRSGAAFTIMLERRTALPRSLWPPID